MCGRVKRKERKKTFQSNFGFFPMVFTFPQLQDLFKISPNPFPNVLNRINLPASWFCLHPYQILPKALCLVLSAARHLCLVLCGQCKCEQPLVLLCLGHTRCPKMLHAEPPSSLVWHKWWKRGKQREEGKLESAMKHLRCSTG